MPKFPSPHSNFPLATRVLLLAQKNGYRGEGAITFPLQDPQGQGVFNLIVTAGTSIAAPEGSFLFDTDTNEFSVRESGDSGAEWKNIGANPDLNAVMLEHAGDAQGALMQLRPLPPVIEPETPDDDDYSGIYDPEYGADVDPAAEAVNENGNLFHHDLTAEAMVTAQNGELSLSTAVRMDNGNHAVSPTDNGVYDINVQMAPGEDRNWCVPISAALTSKVNGTSITDLYVLTVLVRSVRTGRKLLFKAYNINGKAVFEDQNQGVQIPDTFTSPDGSVIQALFYPHEYAKYLGVKAQDTGDSGALIGEYEISVDAARIHGTVQKLECHVQATVADYVPDDYSFIVAPVVAANATAPASMCNEEGYLLVGTGNPAWNLVTATNGELTLIGGGRFYNSLQKVTSTATGVPVYDINVNASEFSLKDWVWVLGGQMVNVQNAPGILDRYSVQLRITKQGAAPVVLDGSFADGKFVFADADGTMTFDDSKTDADGGLFENIQRIVFWPDVFDPQYGTINTNAPIGNYAFEIVAIRDRGDVQPLICAWNVNVVDERLDDTSILVEQQDTLNAVIPALLRKGDDTFIAGTGNPSTGLIVAHNGELAIVGGSRYHNSLQPFEAQLGRTPSYDINVFESTAPSKDWVWLYGLALIDQRNSSEITDLYDVMMTVRVLSTGSTLELFGTFADGVWSFTNTDESVDIVDNVTNADGTYCANIQRVSFYSQLMTAIGDSGTPTGDFEFTIEAIRKYGDSSLLLQWIAHVTDVDTTPVPEPEPEPEPDPVVENEPVVEDEQTQDDPEVEAPSDDETAPE